MKNICTNLIVKKKFGSHAASTINNSNILNKNTFALGVQAFEKMPQVSLFSNLPFLPSDEIVAISDEFQKDTDPKKVNLVRGVYKDIEGKSYKLSCVREAEKIYLEGNYDHEYAPIEGIKSFVDKSLKLGYGDKCKALQEGRIVGMQSLSGTGSLKLGLEFLKYNLNKPTSVYIPNPSWPMHKSVVSTSGLNCKQYKYYNWEKRTADIDAMVEDLDRADDKSIVLIHVSAQNPTGTDPNHQQWQDIFDVISKKNHFPVFDMAYQGFASGDPDKDAYGLRLFANEGYPLALAQSFAKNFGLYGERVGCFSLLTGSSHESNSVLSHLKFAARAAYSNPPKYGAQLVDIILSDQKLFDEWKNELKIMYNRIATVRNALCQLLNQKSDRNWDFINQQIGMFAFTCLTKEQCRMLRKNHHIYMTEDGRMSLSGLTPQNVDYVASSIAQVVSLENKDNSRQEIF